MKYIVAATFFSALASAKKCTELTIPIQASARNGVYNIATPATDVEVTDFILNLIEQGVNYTQTILSGVCNENG